MNYNNGKLEDLPMLLDRIKHKKSMERYVRSLCEEPVPQHTIDFWIDAYEEFLRCEEQVRRLGERFGCGLLSFAAYRLLCAQEKLDKCEEELGVHPYERKRYTFNR